jgi:leucyl/phenylalanyl-tRNA--protein transferase
MDRAFSGVLDGCAAPRPDQNGTWLTEAMKRAYERLHRAGLAHSVEVWMQDELAGGLYGVALGRMFYGESMFSRRTDGSKIALAYLTAQLRDWGFPLIDCQMQTAHLASLGAIEVTRRSFVRAVGRLVKEEGRLGSWALAPAVSEGLREGSATTSQNADAIAPHPGRDRS